MKTVFFAITTLILSSSAFATDNTDYSPCAMGPAPASIVGAWQSRQSDNGFNFKMTLTIGATSAHIANECSYNGQSVTAATSAPSSFDAQRWTVHGSNSDSKTISGPWGQLECNTSIQPMSLEYSFVGRCLSLKDPASGQQMMLVPAQP